MIYLNPGFVVLTWVLIGPSIPLHLAVIFITASIILAILFRRSFHRQTIALLAILAMMFIQSLQLILSSLHTALSKPPPPAEPSLLISRTVLIVLSTLFSLSLRFAELGAIVAACMAVYLYFWKSRLEMSQVFPRTEFIEPSPQLRKTTAYLASLANISCPEVRLIDSGTPLAFTMRTKRKNMIALSVGLLESVDAKEVEACVAHEIAHLKNNDFTIRFLATIAKVALFSKPLSYLIEPAIYRAREFQADKTAASLLGGPASLVSLLTKLREFNSLLSNPTELTSLCACFLDGRRGMLKVFDKHPTLDSRVRLLEEFKFGKRGHRSLARDPVGFPSLP